MHSIVLVTTHFKFLRCEGSRREITYPAPAWCAKDTISIRRNNTVIRSSTAFKILDCNDYSHINTRRRRLRRQQLSGPSLLDLVQCPLFLHSLLPLRRPEARHTMIFRPRLTSGHDPRLLQKTRLLARYLPLFLGNLYSVAADYSGCFGSGYSAAGLTIPATRNGPSPFPGSLMRRGRNAKRYTRQVLRRSSKVS